MAYDGSLIFDTKVSDKGFKAGVAKLKTTGVKSLRTVNQAAKYTAVAIGLVGAASIKVGSDFEAAMSRVKAISGATGREFALLEKTAMQLGKTTVFSASEAAEGMQYLAMAGYDATQIVDAMPGVLNAAAAGQVELGTAADITSNVLSGFGLQAEETSRVADVLTKAFTSSNTSMESLGETMKYAAPVAKAAGFSLEETAAAAGLLGDAGISGSQAGTTLRGVMLRLVNPPKQAAEALDALGVSVVGSNGKLKPLYQIVGELETATKGMTDAQKTAIIAQIAGQNAASGLLAIMDAGPDKLRAFTNELENSGGTAEKVAKDQLDNLQGDLKILGSVLESVGIKIYKSFDGPLRQVVQTLTRYIEKISNTINAHEEITESLDEMGLSLEDVGMDLEKVPTGFEGVVIILGEILADMVTKVAEFAPKILNAAKNLMIAFLNGIRGNKAQILTAATEIITSMIETYIAVIPEMLALGIELITGLMEGMAARAPQLINQATKSLNMLIDAIAESYPSYLDSGAKIVVNLIQGIASMLPNLINKSLDLVKSITDTIIKYLPAILESGIEIIIAIMLGIAEMIPELMDMFFELVVLLADIIIENLPLIIEAGLEIIMALAQGLIDNLPFFIEQVPRIINAFFDGIIANLPTILMAGFKIIVALVKGLIENIPLIVKNIPAIVRAIVNVMIMYDWYQLGGRIMTWLKNGIESMPGKIAEAARNIAKAAWDAIRNRFKDAPQLGKGFVRWLADGISSMPGRITTAARNIGTRALNAVRGQFRQSTSIGKDFVRGIWNGISNLTGWIGNKIAGFASALVGKFKNFFKIKSPSKLMEDLIGRNLILGIGVGMEDEMPELNRDIDRELTGFTRQMEAAVELETYNTGHRAAGVNSMPRLQEVTKETREIAKDTVITGNNFYVREEGDIKKVAREIRRLEVENQRGGR